VKVLLEKKEERKRRDYGREQIVYLMLSFFCYPSMLPFKQPSQIY
jgi:hypothetical protein